MEIGEKNTPNSQTYINIPREDAVNFVPNSHFILNFDVCDAATNNRYANGDNIRLVNLGPIALFNIYKVATSSSKLIEENSHAHIA